MHDRTPWTRGTDGPKRIGLRSYKNLTDFSRPCATCGKSFSIFVTKKIADGFADSNSFGLKNCPEHRRNAVRGDDTELQQLRMANNVMKEELAGLYTRDKELFAQVQVLKAALSVSPTTEEFKNTLVFGRSDGYAMNLDGPKNKMPWEL